MKLTKPQQAALERLTNEWQCAYELRTPIPTLDALHKKGLADRRRERLGIMFSPRTATEYRLSNNQDHESSEHGGDSK